MKFVNALLLFVASAFATPVDIEARQSSTTRNDLESGSSSNCPRAILIFARGSTEAGNLGTVTGVPLASSLSSAIPGIWIQGVGGPYTATLGDNFLSAGTSQAAINEAIRLINLASTKCPNAAILTGGYSQGTAVIFNALSGLSASVKDKVKGAVLFGYTKNRQNGGRIPNYPTDRTKVFCNQGDRVCEGTLIIAQPHFEYTNVARGEGAQFLASKV
jgi:cutinase